MSISKEKFSLTANGLEVDTNGRIAGVLIKHELNGEETGSQEAYILSDLDISYLNGMGRNIFIRFTKSNTNSNFAKSSINEKDIPKIYGTPILFNHSIEVSNTFCLELATGATFPVSEKVDGNGDLLSGYTLLYNYYFDNLVNPNMVEPTIEVLYKRLLSANENI